MTEEAPQPATRRRGDTETRRPLFCQFHIPVWRQTQLRELIERGVHDAQIASITGLSFGSVRRYVMLMMREHGVHTRAELCALRNPDGEEATLP